ncbi:hypothetical protein GCM10022393_27740 [Aquimarina addita]|uniref:Uncharacterized protein n=1 Tax=Aquimarina addita TaxID=870485 RepID=A0ABP6UM11_9FLAO
MNIINHLNYQLSKIEELLNKDLENKEVTYNYLICEDDYKFLDKYELQTYITETKIENLGFLNTINERCSNIIKLWNIDFETLPNKTLDKPFIYNDTETGNYFNSVLDFHAIYLNEEKWKFYNTELGKTYFIKNYEYELYSIADIANRCYLILNWITGTFPDSKSEVHPDVFFQNYLKHGLFSLQSPIKPYDKNNLKLVLKRIEEYESRYKYIYNKLNSKKQLKLKEQVLNHLKEIKKVQTFPIYETKLNELIEEIINLSEDHLNYKNVDKEIPYRDRGYWIEVFNDIDTSKKQKVIVRLLGSKNLERGAYDEGSFNLTVEYLKRFKEDTEFLSKERTLQYIGQLNIKKPKSPKTDSALFNQTVFNAENSYYEFIEDYKLHLEENNLIEELQKVLNNIGSITEKLDYLEEQKIDFKTHNLISPLKIPESIYKDHFRDGLKLPEFTYWFLKFNAKELFSYTINSKDFTSKLNSTLKKEFIQAELNELKEIETNAKELLLKKEVDIHNQNHPNNYNYRREITLLKVLDGNYYQENIINSPHAWGSLETQYYFKYHLLRPYLEKIKSTKKALESVNNADDPLYSLEQIDPKTLRKTDLYRIHKDQIKSNGYLCVNLDDGSQTKIYTPELAIILTSGFIKGKKRNSDTIINIEELDFLRDYNIGFKEGQEYFKKEFNPTLEILYGINSTTYIKNLHYNYFHFNFGSFKIGWNYIRHNYPMIINRKTSKEYGYYSGIVSEMELLIKKHPELFKDFNKCGSEKDYKTIKTKHSSTLSVNVESEVQNLEQEKGIEIPRETLKDDGKQNITIEQKTKTKQSENIQLLTKIWLAEPKLAIKDLIEKGIEKGMWDKDLILKLRRGSLYGSEKVFLGSLSVALRSYSINSNTDYKLIGEIFCKVFNVDIKTGTSTPYKSFQTGNSKYIDQIKRAFNIK